MLNTWKSNLFWGTQWRIWWRKCHLRNERGDGDIALCMWVIRLNRLQTLFSVSTCKDSIHDSMNIGKSSQLGIHGFGTLHNTPLDHEPPITLPTGSTLTPFRKGQLTTFPLIHCFEMANRDTLDTLPLLYYGPEPPITLNKLVTLFPGFDHVNWIRFILPVLIIGVYGSRGPYVVYGWTNFCSNHSVFAFICYAAILIDLFSC